MLCCGASAAGSEGYLIELQGLHLLRPQVCHLLIQLPCVLCCFRQSLHNNTFLHGRLNSFSSARVPARTLWHHRAPGQQLKAQFQRQQQSCCPCFSDAVRKLWRKKGYNPKQAQHSTAHMAHTPQRTCSCSCKARFSAAASASACFLSLSLATRRFFSAPTSCTGTSSDLVGSTQSALGPLLSAASLEPAIQPSCGRSSSCETTLP